MNRNSRYNWLRSWSAAVALAGFSAVVSLPAISQTSPSPTPEVSPSPTPEASPSPTPEVSPSPAPEASPSPTPEASPSPAAAPTTSDRSLTELLQQASSSGSFTILARAVQAAGVANAAQGGGYTIFAPTDAAFSALPSGVLEKLLLPQNRALLAKVLAYHVVPQTLTSSDLRTGGLETLGGGIAIRVASDRVIVNNGSVIQADIQAGNGVVHAVNRVLLPRQLRQRLAAL